MKKTLLALGLGMCATLGFAQTSRTYEDNLVVTVNGESTEPAPATIHMEEQADGTCNLSLKNFVLAQGSDEIYVGHINLTGVKLTQEAGYRSFSTQQTITIEPGDDPDKDWFGPMLGLVPIDMQGVLTGDKLYCTIDIDMRESNQQKIYVTFGTAPAGIASVLATSPDRVNVYNAHGICVRRDVKKAEALHGLTRGIYIVNGKKLIK